ncbi:MAG: hypothetical protein AAF702_02195 [Chloroflexota bacterium]
MVSMAVVSLIVGLLAGWIGQRSRFCSIGGLRDFLLTGDTALLRGVLALFVAAWFIYPLAIILQPADIPALQEVTASEPIDDPTLALAEEQPRWRTIWSSVTGVLTQVELVVFVAGIGLGMVSLFMDGCPYRQHVLAGQGRLDSVVYLGGFYVAALLFQWWSTPLLRLIF